MDSSGNTFKIKNSVSPPLAQKFSEVDGHIETKQIKGISFRDKRLGWKKFSFSLTLAETTAEGKQNSVTLSSIHLENPFMKVFLQNINIRPSCYNCPAKVGKSLSDITIADFWGIENVLPSFNDQRGVGLLMVNTIRGEEIVNSLDLETVSVSLDEAIKGNPSYFKPVLPNQNRARFFRKLGSDKSIIRLMESVTKPSVKTRILCFLSKIKHNFLKF